MHKATCELCVYGAWFMSHINKHYNICSFYTTKVFHIMFARISKYFQCLLFSSFNIFCTLNLTNTVFFNDYFYSHFTRNSQALHPQNKFSSMYPFYTRLNSYNHQYSLQKCNHFQNLEIIELEYLITYITPIYLYNLVTQRYTSQYTS